MSHITRIKGNLTIMEAVEAACTALGATLHLGQTYHRTYYGKKACDHAISIPGADYDIGLVKAESGPGYDITFDQWGPGHALTMAFGERACKLQQEYRVATIERRHRVTLARKGFRMTRENLPTGQVRMRLARR